MEPHVTKNLVLVSVWRNPSTIEECASVPDSGVGVRTSVGRLLQADAVERITAATADLEVGLFIAFRACFIAHGAIMDYGVLGKHEDADPVAEIFRTVALRKEHDSYLILEMHHAFHPEITLIDETHAEGTWTLAFRRLDLSARTQTVASMEYEDMTRPLEDSIEVTQGWGLSR